MPAADRPATREWWTRARVRIVAECGAGSVDPIASRDFKIGEELVMVQWGRAGRPVERDTWWTSTDIDGAFIIPAANVEVLEVLEEIDPYSPCPHTYAFPGGQCFSCGELVPAREES